MPRIRVTLKWAEDFQITNISNRATTLKDLNRDRVEDSEEVLEIAKHPKMGIFNDLEFRMITNNRGLLLKVMVVLMAHPIHLHRHLNNLNSITNL